MLDKMKQLMEMKKQADRMKKQLDGIIVDVSEVRGIDMTITGSQVVRSLTIDESLLGPENKGRLERDLVRTFNAAVKKSQAEGARQAMASMPGGFPGMNF